MKFPLTFELVAPVLSALNSEQSEGTPKEFDEFSSKNNIVASIKAKIKIKAKTAIENLLIILDQLALTAQNFKLPLTSKRSG